MDAIKAISSYHVNMSYESTDISLPIGGQDYDQHYRTPNDIRTVAMYTHERSAGLIHAHDPIWGKETIGDKPYDEVLVELFDNSLVNRLSDIEQLTLPQRFTTMPNSYGFMRWEHAWGSVIFVRKMIEKMREGGREVEDRDAMKLQLRTFVSDIGHTAFSHLGDWLFQGFGGDEDQHDKELNEVLEAGGVNDILRKHGYEPEEIIFPKIDDWIECASPDLCVDRVDYGSREIGRWVSGYKSSSDWLSEFTVDEQDRIIMPDKFAARQYGLSFGLLATEHWAHPVHRLQLQLFAEMVKGIIADDIIPSEAGIYHPRDILYELDKKISGYGYAVGTLNYELTGVLLDIARAQRKAFHFEREAEIQHFLRRVKSDDHERLYVSDGPLTFPHPLQPIHKHKSRTGLLPNNLEIIPVTEGEEEVVDFGKLSHTYDVYLPALKPRSIDPLYYEKDGTVQRLSENDEVYARLNDEQRAIQKQAYVARWFGRPEFIEKLRLNISEVNERWEHRLSSKRADRETMARMFGYVGMSPVRNGEWLRISWVS